MIQIISTWRRVRDRQLSWDITTFQQYFRRTRMNASNILDSAVCYSKPNKVTWKCNFVSSFRILNQIFLFCFKSNFKNWSAINYVVRTRAFNNNSLKFIQNSLYQYFKYEFTLLGVLFCAHKCVLRPDPTEKWHQPIHDLQISVENRSIIAAHQLRISQKVEMIPIYRTRFALMMLVLIALLLSF